MGVEPLEVRVGWDKRNEYREGVGYPVWRFVKALVLRLGRNDIGAYSAALAYNFLFSLVPFALLLTSLLGFLHLPSDPRQWLQGPLQTILPTQVDQMILHYGHDIIQRRHPALISVGAMGFLWGMSGAFRQLIDAFNHAYEFPRPWQRPIWKTYALSLVAGAGIGLLIVSAIALVLLGHQVLHTLGMLLWHIHIPALVEQVIRWGGLFGFLWFSLTLSYAVLPDRPQPFRWRSLGTLTALVLWLVLSWGFSQYTRDFGQFNRIYGSLGGIILLMLYLYLTGLTILIGAEINAMRIKTPPPTLPAPRDTAPTPQSHPQSPR